jgi:type VI secretion system secreted protein Hcp
VDKGEICADGFDRANRPWYITNMKPLLLALAAFVGLPYALHAQTITETVTFDSSSGINSGSAITLMSFKLGVQQSGLVTMAGGGGSASKSQFTPVTLFKTIDQTTPELFLACALGKVIKSATISAVSDNGQTAPVTFFQIVIKNVIVSSVNDDGSDSDGGTPFLETIALSYGQIEWLYTPVSGGLQTLGGFDVKRNISLPFTSFQPPPQ